MPAVNLKELGEKLKEYQKQDDPINFEGNYDDCNYDHGDFVLMNEPDQEPMNVADAGKWNNGPFVKADHIHVEYKIDPEPIGAAPPPMVGHVVQANPNHYIQNFQNAVAAAPANYYQGILHPAPAPGVNNNYNAVAEQGGPVGNGYIGVVGGNHNMQHAKMMPKPMGKPKLQVQYGDEEDCCDEDCGTTGYAGNVSKTRGLMVFYINTNGLAAGQALDLLDKVKAQYSKVEKTLRQDNIEVMWLPTGAGETSSSYFSFR